MTQKTHAAPRLDPRDPFVLDTRELGRRPGSMRAVQVTVEAPENLGAEMIGVPAGSPVELDLRLESVVEGVLVSGTVAVDPEGECARCLRPITDRLTVNVQELFAYPAGATDETTDEDEIPRLVGDFLDLEPTVRDAVVLGLPLAPLCDDDCRGLCATCGARWEDLPADHGHETMDPRWAALAERFDADRTDSQE